MKWIYILNPQKGKTMDPYFEQQIEYTSSVHKKKKQRPWTHTMNINCEKYISVLHPQDHEQPI